MYDVVYGTRLFLNGTATGKGKGKTVILPLPLPNGAGGATISRISKG
jgi:hypothetical protein